MKMNKVFRFIKNVFVGYIWVLFHAMGAYLVISLVDWEWQSTYFFTDFHSHVLCFTIGLNLALWFEMLRGNYDDDLLDTPSSGTIRISNDKEQQAKIKYTAYEGDAILFEDEFDVFQ
jgi:hypothetical protein